MTEQEVRREFERCAADIAKRIPTLCDYPEPVHQSLSKLTAFDVLKWAAGTYAIVGRPKITLVQWVRSRRRWQEARHELVH